MIFSKLMPVLWASTGFCLYAQERPNILLINIDDYGWADMSSNGSSYYETPQIDRLRAQGVWMEEAYAGAANSAPSRACLLTGMYTPRHGMYTVGEPNRGDASKRRWVAIPNRTSLEEGIQMLPRLLQEAGYETCHVGKWHVTADPLACGMDINIGGNHAGNPSTYFSPYANPNLPDGPTGEYLTDRLTQEAIRYLKERDADKPFFLYFATYAVHTPLEAPAELVEKYRKKASTEAHDNPVYAAMVENMDRNVGRLLDEIERLGLAERTLIIFTSDNGGLYRVSRQWPLRAGKGSFYEGGIRVPLIIYQKGRFERQEIKHLPLQQLDLFPTLLEIAGIPRTGLCLDGVSLLPLLRGDTAAYVDRPLFWHFPAYLEGTPEETRETKSPYFRTCPVSVVRKGDWKLIENYEDGTFELYNIRRDISEQDDLLASQPDRLRELSSLLEAWKEAVQAPVPHQANPKNNGELTMDN